MRVLNRGRLSRVIVATAITAVLVGAPTPAIAQPVIVDSGVDGELSAYGGVAAWSRADPKRGGSELRIFIGGVVSTAVIRRESGGFEPDVGPGPDGHVVVVYSRCGLPKRAKVKIRGCDLYSYDVKTKRERKLNSVSTEHRLEGAPSVWGSRIAFSGQPESRPSATPHLYVGNLKSGSVHRVKVPVRNRGDEWQLRGTDLRGSHLLTEWLLEAQPCDNEYPSEDDHGGDGAARYEVWTSKVRATRLISSKRLVTRCNGEQLSHPFFDRATPSWLGSASGGAGGLAWLESSSNRVGLNGSTVGIANDGSSYFSSRQSGPDSADVFRAASVAELE
jgi:hypothetical protein